MTDASSNFSIQRIFAKTFAYIFFGLSAAIVLSTFTSAFGNIFNGDEITSVIIQMVNTSIIAIAVFELAIVINKEYGDDNGHDVVHMLRRTLPRFIGTVCVALSLEGLIMVIKYSQLDLAGNLYYPVAIIISAAFLLIALGVFLKFSPTE
ncbi:MAG: hypothetical protein RQ763_07195 [Sulfurimonas sp.]|uniref:hypothetical protein n=1 Tax=Sulfurimonas sp. TaxID=2022749 RepID=UPI0028CBD1D1|nr:hypothetical protein [Sulfurimonas sp.]MDT8338968.1 hypothetical protein [Sulfurimonas sp.]